MNNQSERNTTNGIDQETLLLLENLLRGSSTSQGARNDQQNSSAIGAPGSGSQLELLNALLQRRPSESASGMAARSQSAGSVAVSLQQQMQLRALLGEELNLQPAILLPQGAPAALVPLAVAQPALDQWSRLLSANPQSIPTRGPSIPSDTLQQILRQSLQSQTLAQQQTGTRNHVQGTTSTDLNAILAAISGVYCQDSIGQTGIAFPASPVDNQARVPARPDAIATDSREMVRSPTTLLAAHAHPQLMDAADGSLSHIGAVRSSTEPTRQGVGDQKRRMDRNIMNNEQFPAKLHRMIQDAADEGRQDIIGYNSEGTAFHIHDPTSLCNEMLPEYFRHKRLDSFKRQLSSYGFSRIPMGPDEGGYEHPLFRRDCPEVVHHILRTSRTRTTGDSPPRSRTKNETGADFGDGRESKRSRTKTPSETTTVLKPPPKQT